MYLLTVSYSQVPALVEPYIPDHGTWVKKYFDAGILLVAGSKKSGLGGVLLAKAIPREDLLSILSEDPYVRFQVAEYQIVDFDCKLAGPGLDSLKNQ